MYYFQRLRQIVIDELAKESAQCLTGEIEVDESYFGGIRKGKRGRGAAGKIPVFGLLKRGGRFIRSLFPMRRARHCCLLSEIKHTRTALCSDCWSAYNALDVSEFKHHRINHSKRFAQNKNHINGIENFWSQAKRHMRKFNGVPREQFPLFLKECERRFNNPKPKDQLAQLKQRVKEVMV